MDTAKNRGQSVLSLSFVKWKRKSILLKKQIPLLDQKRKKMFERPAPQSSIFEANSREFVSLHTLKRSR